MIQVSLEMFDKDFKELFDKYIALDKELMGYRGVEITKHNIEKINAIVVGMQDAYAQLYESLQWINHWNKNAAVLMTEHKKFMDDIKVAGGVPEKKEENMKEAEA